MAVSKEFQGKVKDALNNDNLRRALTKFGNDYPASREKAYIGKDIEGLRDYISTAKREAAQKVDLLVEKFTQEAEKRGAKVYFAPTGEDANRYIAQVAAQNAVKTVVKSKSMASEEIHLNSYLEGKGIEVTETDLGEWIIQLMGQKPSHMVMPAIHLTRQEVADTFSKHLNEKLPADPDTLTKVARRELRKKFLGADMGISGANMAVADNGSMVIMTNEGNARLTTTLPPVHVALVGIEKFVENMETVTKVLEALPRSATGQTITSYVTMIKGSTPTWKDGKIQDKELNIVILDNGRSELINDPVFLEAAQCIRCASCLNVCPVYQLVGGHVYGHIYAGGIGSILTAFFNGENEAFDPQNLCISCGKCATICPGKINIPDLIKELRQRLTEKKGLSFTEGFVLKKILSDPRTFHKWLRRAKHLQKPWAKDGYIRHLPLAFSKHTEHRSLPVIADKPLRDMIPELKRNIKKPKARAAFYAGCVIDFCYPEVGQAVFKTLQDRGIEMVFPDEQSCCGAPASYMGDRETAKEMAKQNISALEKADVDYIVAACPTCIDSLKHDFVHLLEDDKQWKQRAEKLAVKVKDYSELMNDLPGKYAGKAKGTKVTYHDSCHYNRKLGLSDKPRNLLREGYNLVEIKECDRCCGFGGSYTVKFPQISAEIMKRKVKNIDDSGAAIVAMDCPGCMIQLKGGLEKAGSKVKVKHSAELLAEGDK
ncbi:LUD domain-containing protein [Metallumcola ferriviriculae]|uniref:LUD domain-containing protein n=1 Tax=Metallumcola ferriviriculae TaxID=3039180 RepID=A0AAU0UKH8_9FIRM|nr:LUD domain-containing protein [Desulfitibacteraceae bacterium MK1]